MKKEYFLHPKINAFVLGLAIGLPQGISVLKKIEFLKDIKPSALSMSLFSLFAPPILMSLNFIFTKNKKENELNSNILKFINLNFVVVWMCFSLAVASAITIFLNNASEVGYGISFIFACAGMGFIAAEYIQIKLKVKKK